MQKEGDGDMQRDSQRLKDRKQTKDIQKLRKRQTEIHTDDEIERESEKDNLNLE